MRSIWELTRGIAKIVETVLSRVDKLERDASSQELRIAGLEQIRGVGIHSMELKELERRELEGERQGSLSDKDLQDELARKYGKTRWAKGLIKSIISRRKTTKS